MTQAGARFLGDGTPGRPRRRLIFALGFALLAPLSVAAGTAEAGDRKPREAAEAEKGASSSKKKPSKKAAPKKAAPKKASPKKAAKKRPRGRPAAPRRAKRSSVSFDPKWASYPSARYGAMDAAGCMAELRARGIEATPAPGAKGVMAPVRLPGPVGGVRYRTELPPAKRLKNPYDVFDCRLVLALSDWSPMLVARGFDEVVMFSAWRPPGRSYPEGKLATRHPGALAIDVMKFGRKRSPEGQEGAGDESWLVVEKSFGGRIGSPVCGQGAPVPGDADAKELRAIVCELADAHIFTVVLTPNYDRAHFNHLHLEVTPEVTWHLLK